MSAKNLSNEEYAILVQQSPVLIWRSDTSMACDYFNDRWLEFTGRSLERELGSGWAEGVHPDDFERCLKVYRESFAEREVFEMEYRLRRHDEVFRWVFDRGVPFFRTDGSFAGYIGSCIDVHERKQAEEDLKKLRESELRRLRGLLPICSSCKQIRDDAGYWTELETYLQQNRDLRFTHSLCPSCISKFYPDIDPSL